jgi:hypothetical protein
MDNCCICCNLVYFSPRFGILRKEKSGNPVWDEQDGGGARTRNEIKYTGKGGGRR